MLLSNLNNIIAEAYGEYGLTQIPTEVEKFTEFFHSLQCKNVMEVGTYFGGMFYTMCKTSHPKGKKISVDYPFYGWQAEDPKYIKLMNNIKTFAENVFVIRGDSHATSTYEEVKSVLNGEELDFLFIDGDHSYEGVKQDFEMYKEFVKDGGYIAFHDINNTEFHRNLNCRVDILWDELPHENKFEFNSRAFAGGIGVIQVFKHKRKLDISLGFEAPGKITITSNSNEVLDLIVSVREKQTNIPIYYCDLHFGGAGHSWYIIPIGDTNWMHEKYMNTFILEFYDKNKNFVDSKELKIKDDIVPIERVGTRIYSPFDCLWINYKQMFLEKIYDRFDVHNLNTVIDLGANVGMFVNYISERGARKIHAIEPTQKAMDELKKQFYYYNWVIAHKIGIDAQDGQKTIYTNNDNSTISSFLSKTSDNITEESVQMMSMDTFYRVNSLHNIDKVDLIKVDIEGMEYAIFESMSDDCIRRSERYLIEYHMNDEQTRPLDNLIARFERLGYEITIVPDVDSNVQGHFFAKKGQNTLQKVLPEKESPNFPKQAFVTFTNEYYLPITERLVKSLQNNSSYPIIVYSINCDVNFSYPNMFTKRIDSDNIQMPRFEAFDKVISHKQGETVEVLSPEGSFGIVDRNNINTYLTLSRKPLIILDAINNGLERGIFLDADGIAKENIDSAFDYLSQAEDYPLVGKGLFEYMMLNGTGDPAVGPSLEQPLMDLMRVKHRTMYYVSTNFILFNNNMKDFMEEWKWWADRPEIINDNVKYAPYHDETLVNVLLWKYNATKQLPRVHYNLTDAQRAEEFYTTEQRGVYTESDWHYIPHDINDIKFFHGCKSLKEIDKTIELIESRKEKFEFTYRFKKLNFRDTNRIAIVTLFDKNYYDLANITIPNVAKYADKHKYDVIFFDDIIDKNRPPQWSKIKAVEYVLNTNNYDWVWWLDVDALIMNSDIPLESMLDSHYDMVFTENKYSVISNGSSFYRNTELTKQFLQDCYNLNRDYLKNIDVHTFDHEQKPMRELYLRDEDYRSRIKLIHERICNSYWYTSNPSVLAVYPDWNSADNIYQNGDFVVNFCGRTKDERIEIMKQFPIK